MINFLEILVQILNSYHLLFLITTFSLLSKLTIFIFLSYRSYKSPKNPHPLYYLIWVLISSFIIDFAWFLKLLEILHIPHFDYHITLFFIRIAWGCHALLYQSLSLFIESLSTQQFTLCLRQKIISCVSLLFSFLFFTLALINFISLSPKHIPSYETTLQTIEILFCLFIVLLLSSYLTVKKLKRSHIPSILKKQISTFIFAIIVPYWLSDFFQAYPFQYYPSNSTLARITASPAFASLATIIITYAIFYSARKMMGLRFLNFKQHVQSPAKFTFMDNFKTILQQLSHVTNVYELSHITQVFFKESFLIPISKTNLIIRSEQKETNERENYNKIPSIVETFLTTHKDTVCDYLQHHKIVIYDELAFSNFYEEHQAGQALLAFMETIDADVFIPIYEKQKILAFIMVDRHARVGEFYSNIDRDEMLVFASYLGNIINLLQNKNLETLIHHEKELKEELYAKHQEINQYKESIRSFLRTDVQKEIGIIFYKNRQFNFANQAAKKMVPVNINTYSGHYLSKAFKQIASQVEEYKTPQTLHTKDSTGKKIILSAVPSLEHKNVIITVSYPDVSDIIKQQINVLKDPSERDYLLYLETTKSGKLINQLIPGSGEQLLNFKIELLKLALSKKIIVLDMPHADVIPTVELLHHISLREQLHVVNLQGPSDHEVIIKIFGINKLFKTQDTQEQPLLAKLNQTGTLFIKNIEFLNLEAQEFLAEYIHYGSFKPYKSEQRIPSDVRIICSSNQNLSQLVQEERFSQKLFTVLKQTTLCMPSLITLPDEELKAVIDGFTDQALNNQTFTNLLALTPKDKMKLATQRPASLHELKIKVQNILLNKTKESNIQQETDVFDPAYKLADPDLAQAARLGKHALKDRKIMTMLWNKFKNQNKIATLLGVNRSSVNRRCKEYHLI